MNDPPRISVWAQREKEGKTSPSLGLYWNDPSGQGEGGSDELVCDVQPVRERGIAPTWAERVKGAGETSLRSILAEAVEKGGNGVVGISLSYEVLGYEQNMVMVLVAARGTAVIVEQ